MNRQAFTLIELGVVISILGILASLLLPALSRAQAKGWQSGCFNNARQHALAILMYADDHQDELPPVTMETAAGEEIEWTALLSAYLPQQRVHLCPSDKHSKRVSYGFNELAFVDFEDDRPIRAKRLTEFPRAASTLALGDLGVDDDFATSLPDTLKMVAPTDELDDEEDARPAARHSSRCNLGFLDGHAEAMDLDNFYHRQSPSNRWFLGG